MLADFLISELYHNRKQNSRTQDRVWGRVVVTRVYATNKRDPKNVLTRFLHRLGKGYSRKTSWIGRER